MKKIIILVMILISAILPISAFCVNPAIAESTPKWEKLYYVDEFKMPTEDYYYAYIADGTFSNSATLNSKLTAVVFFYPEQKGKSKNIIAFRFFEYGSTLVTGMIDPYTLYSIHMMDNNGEISETEADLYIGEHDICKYGPSPAYDVIYNALFEGGTVRFSIETTNRTPKSTYVFTVEDEGGLAAILSETE